MILARVPSGAIIPDNKIWLSQNGIEQRLENHDLIGCLLPGHTTPGSHCQWTTINNMKVFG